MAENQALTSEKPVSSQLDLLPGEKPLAEAIVKANEGMKSDQDAFKALVKESIPLEKILAFAMKGDMTAANFAINEWTKSKIVPGFDESVAKAVEMGKIVAKSVVKMGEK